MDLDWSAGVLTRAIVRASVPLVCRVRSAVPLGFAPGPASDPGAQDAPVADTPEPGVFEFEAESGGVYELVPG